jgi:hypothetical protein
MTEELTGRQRVAEAADFWFAQKEVESVSKAFGRLPAPQTPEERLLMSDLLMRIRNLQEQYGVFYKLGKRI